MHDAERNGAEWPPRVKVCGLTRAEDAAVAAAAGAHYLGAILAPGYGRTVTAARARVIFGDFAAARVGVFVDAEPGEVRAAAAEAGLTVAQLHGDESPETAARVRAGGLVVWKAVRVRSGGDVEAALDRYADAVDALLLDGYSPAAHGGTGTAFDWHDAARRLQARTGCPRIVAAGGLRTENVARAARILRPHAVDVSSGVESAPGVKDAAAVHAFAAAVRALAA